MVMPRATTASRIVAASGPELLRPSPDTSITSLFPSKPLSSNLAAE